MMPKPEEISAIVLAAGKGVRMISELNKVLHPLCGKPLIYYVIKKIKEIGIRRILVVVGEEEAVKEKVKAFFENIEFVHQKKPLGTANAIQQAKGKIKKERDVLVISADTPLIEKPTLRRLIDKHAREGNSCTFLSAHLTFPEGYGRVIRAGREILEIKEEEQLSKEEKEIREVNGGVYIFKVRDLIRVIPQIYPNNKKGEYYLTESIRLLRREGRKIGCVLASEKEILGINTRDALSRAERIMQERILAKMYRKGVSIIDPHTAYISEETEIGKDTLIYPFTFIQGKVKIGRGCQIGPFAHLRGECVIGDNVVIGNFVEIVRCTIRDNCRIKHHSYLGDCLVEEGVNIGAGTITANYDGEKKHRTVIKKGAFIGSGTILVAPVKVGEGALTGAGTVVLRNRDVQKKEVVVGVPARVLRRRSNG